MQIKTITVIGAGIMGRGIAQVASVGGYLTYLTDVSENILQKAYVDIESHLKKGEQLGKIPTGTTEAALARLNTTSSAHVAAQGADLIIEAVPESLSLKVETFKQVNETAPEHCVFASNTSALSITEMATLTGRPDRFIGIHFFNPVHIMRLVEIISGAETSAETRLIAHDVAHQMGKETVFVRESPGGVATRMNALIGNEAFRILQEGIASAEDIDKALKLGLNHPMGPFELVDLVGLDTRLSILRYLHENLGEKYRPSDLLVEFVNSGRLGRKTGRGVYQYDEKGRRI